MSIIRTRNLTEAFELCSKEAADVVALFGAIERQTKKIESLEDCGSIYYGKAAITVLSNGDTISSLEEKRNRLYKPLWGCTIKLNSEYHKLTGKYVMNHIPNVEYSTYIQLYEELDAVI